MSTKIKKFTNSEITLISQIRYQKSELNLAWSIISNLIELMESKLPEKDIEEIRTQHRNWKETACWMNQYLV